MRISFDIDGVIANGDYVPRENRTHDWYSSRPLFSPDVPEKLNKLALQFDVWILSIRKMDRGFATTIEWLNKVGIDIKNIRNVVCGLTVEEKGKLVDLIGSVAHFDDDVRVLDQIFVAKQYLIDNPEYSLNQTTSTYPRLYTWQDIMKVCSNLIKSKKE